MTLLAVCGGLLLAVALIVREIQQGRERTARLSALERLHQLGDAQARQLRRAREDLYVMRVLLQERGVFSDEEFARSRIRLIEDPRRRAEERSQLTRDVNLAPGVLIIDDGDSIH